MNEGNVIYVKCWMLNVELRIKEGCANERKRKLKMQMLDL